MHGFHNGNTGYYVLNSVNALTLEYTTAKENEKAFEENHSFVLPGTDHSKPCCTLCRNRGHNRKCCPDKNSPCTTAKSCGDLNRHPEKREQLRDLKLHREKIENLTKLRNELSFRKGIAEQTIDEKIAPRSA